MRSIATLGTHMNEVACKKLEDNAELFRRFVKCIQDAHVDIVAPAHLLLLFQEYTQCAIMN